MTASALLEPERKTSVSIGRGSRTGEGRLLLVGLLLLGSPAACAESPAPAWISLAGRLEVTRREGTRSYPHPLSPARIADIVIHEDEAFLQLSLGAEDWRFAPDYGCWFAPFPLHLPVDFTLGALRLTTPAGPIPAARPGAVTRDHAPGFTFARGKLALAGSSGTPPGAVCVTCALPAPARNGLFDLGMLSGRGIAFLPGDSGICLTGFPARSVLRFATSVQPLVGSASTANYSRFQVLLDGKLIFDEVQEEAAPRGWEWHAVPLPPVECERARLDLRFEGGLAQGLFFDPVIGPSDVGRRDERPWRSARPDIVMFVADTFRADNMTAYGGEPGIAPNLDQLARESLCFLHACSTAPWTLPSHASMLSGFFPMQVLSSPRTGKLPQEVETVVEELSSAGYRTAAFTGGGFVSGEFGLAQGFDLFSEHAGDLETALAQARAFLDADDGRPVFLFVHTYRVHWPYLVSARTRELLGDRLGIQGDSRTTLDQFLDEARRAGFAGVHGITDLEGLALTPRLQALAHELHAHYLGSVADLDHDLGGFVDHLRRSGFLASGYLVFTSDHGEAFGEHGSLFHDRDPYDEQVRVPLLVAGRGITGRQIDHLVSLIDLAPTIADLASVPGAPDWPGRSLLKPAVDGALFGFEFSRRPPGSMFVLEGSRKVFMPEGAGGPGPLRAYDLASDPREEHNLADEAAWPNGLWRKHSAALERWLTPIVKGEMTEIDRAKADELSALGY